MIPETTRLQQFRTLLARAIAPFDARMKAFEYATLYPMIAQCPPALARICVGTRKGLSFRGRSTRRGIAANMERVLAPRFDRGEYMGMAGRNESLLRFFKLNYYVFLKRMNDGLRRISVVGAEHLFHCTDNGRPIYFFTAHYGALYQIPLIGADYGFHPVVLLEHPGRRPLPHWEDHADKQFFHRHIDRPFRSKGVRFHAVGDRFRPVYEGLKDKGMLGVAIDVPANPLVSAPATVVSFLGGSARFNATFAKLAVTNRAVLFPLFLEVSDGLRYTLELRPPIDTDQWSGSACAVEACMQRCFDAIESRIYENPSQWWLWKDLDNFWSKDENPPRE